VAVDLFKTVSSLLGLCDTPVDWGIIFAMKIVLIKLIFLDEQGQEG